MEKLSSFERVVGKISESAKEQILRDKGERFNDQAFENLKGKEREKTPGELEIISLANQATNDIRHRYGLEDFDIPSKNIHVVVEEAWPQEKTTAMYNSMLQGIAMRERPSKIAFALTSFHEMIHFKSYNALQITTGENHKLEPYRLGLVVRTRDGASVYFANLTEAVTEEMTKRFATHLVNDLRFAEEMKQTKDIMARHPRAVARSGELLFDDDTYYAEIDSKKSWKEAVGRLFGGPGKIHTSRFAYEEERKTLNTLIDKLFERNSEQFQDREEVFEVFAKGMMTGNILPIGRLIDSTFGKGTLRDIGELDQDAHAQMRFVESL